MKRVLCFVLTFVMMTSVLMTTVLAVDTEGDIVVPETLTEEAQGDLAGTIIYGSESIRRLPMTETSRNLDTKSWTTLYSDNNWLNEIATITNKMGNPGSIYVRVVAYDKNKTAHTIVSKSPEIGVGASYETPVIDKDYAKYTVSINVSVISCVNDAVLNLFDRDIVRQGIERLNSFFLLQKGLELCHAALLQINGKAAAAFGERRIFCFTVAFPLLRPTGQQCFFVFAILRPVA